LLFFSVFSVLTDTKPEQQKACTLFIFSFGDPVSRAPWCSSGKTENIDFAKGIGRFLLKTLILSMHLQISIETLVLLKALADFY
jgi:hypothetical protein